MLGGAAAKRLEGRYFATPAFRKERASELARAQAGAGGSDESTISRLLGEIEADAAGYGIGVALVAEVSCPAPRFGRRWLLRPRRPRGEQTSMPRLYSVDVRVLGRERAPQKSVTPP